jgi:1-acyl-sn-glycerol-3-phosphate acyltransferase
MKQQKQHKTAGSTTNLPNIGSAWKQLQAQADFIQHRLQGDYQTDIYGMDAELIERVRPFLRFMYHSWWRISAEGVEHIPASGRGLLVSNHSGVIPWDGAMIATAVYENHPQSRIVRNLFMHWFSTLPFVGSTLSSLGSVPGLPENAEQLLHADELVCTFPEGVKGVGKLFRDRYKLARFGRGGFVQTALRTGSPIIPVAVVGAEEIYPMLVNVKPVARLLGTPYFPLTPTFPWLGPVGTVPLPVRWHITFCPPVELDGYTPPDADDPLVVFELTERVRHTIQTTLNENVAARSSWW